MNDADTLKQHNIKDGLTVHLVIKTPPRPEPEGGPRRPPGNPPDNWRVYNNLYNICYVTLSCFYSLITEKKIVFF